MPEQLAGLSSGNIGIEGRWKELLGTRSDFAADPEGCEAARRLFYAGASASVIEMLEAVSSKGLRGLVRELSALREEMTVFIDSVVEEGANA